MLFFDFNCGYGSKYEITNSIKCNLIRFELNSFIIEKSHFNSIDWQTLKKRTLVHISINSQAAKICAYTCLSAFFVSAT